MLRTARCTRGIARSRSRCRTAIKLQVCPHRARESRALVGPRRRRTARRERRMGRCAIRRKGHVGNEHQGHPRLLSLGLRRHRLRTLRMMPPTGSLCPRAQGIAQPSHVGESFGAW